MIEKNKINKNLKKKLSLSLSLSLSLARSLSLSLLWIPRVCPFPLISGVEYGSKIPDVKIWQGKVPLS
jgi:hypothetical protein